MTKHEIKVYDYYNARKGGDPSHYNGNEEPFLFEVEAWCVGGSEGILAYFVMGDRFYIASGDDGHWVLKYTCGTQWLPKIKEAMNSIE